MGQLAIHRSIWSGRAVETSRRRQRRHADGREHLLGGLWGGYMGRDGKKGWVMSYEGYGGLSGTKALLRQVSDLFREKRSEWLWQRGVKLRVKRDGSTNLYIQSLYILLYIQTFIYIYSYKLYMYTSLYILVICISQGITRRFDHFSTDTVASVEKWTNQEASNICGLDQDGNGKRRLGSGSVFQVAHWVHSWGNSEVERWNSQSGGDRSLPEPLEGWNGCLQKQAWWVVREGTSGFWVSVLHGVLFTKESICAGLELKRKCELGSAV
jgi:hypothetical protein